MSDKKIYAVEVEQCTDFYVYVEAESTWDAERVAEHALAAEGSPSWTTSRRPIIDGEGTVYRHFASQRKPKAVNAIEGPKGEPLDSVDTAEFTDRRSA